MEKFDAKKISEDIIEFIRKFYKDNNLKGAVIGISGGKDSGVVAGLMSKAIGSENIVGLKLPCHSQQEDSTLADLLSQHYGFPLYNCDLTATFDNFENAVHQGFGDIKNEDLKNSSINLKPRLRMSALYYVAAMMSSIKNGTYIVIGTSNKSELFVGYFTKGGDNVNDLQILSDLTCEEVIAVGDAIGVPHEILYRTPSDGLSNMSDEDKLGVKYSEISQYMENPDFVSNQAKTKIEKLHKNAAHKFKTQAYTKK